MPPLPKLLAATVTTLLLALPVPALASGHGHGHSHRHHHSAATHRHHARSHAAKPRLKAPRAPKPHREGRHRRGEAQAPATVATVPAPPCQNTELTPTPANVALVRESVLCLINQERAEHGEQPLIANARLQEAAEGHAGELVADDYFAHVSPSGETPVDRIRQTGYIPGPSVGYVIGENLAWGTYDLSTPKTIVAAWIASPGHLANILEAQYRETGIGITPAVPQSLGEGAPGATYAQEFGVIIH